VSKDADKAIIPPFIIEFDTGASLTLTPEFDGAFLPMFKDVPEGTTEEQARFSYAHNLFQAIGLVVQLPEVEDE
jgi:hypothetical protein